MEITLPDGSSKILESGSTGYDLAKSIGSGLAKSAVAININGENKDLFDKLPDNSSVSIITIDSQDGLEIMRHTLTAQVLAKAIKNLYPDSNTQKGQQMKKVFIIKVTLRNQ